MRIDQTIRQLIRLYLDGALSFEDFEDRFLDVTWDLHRPGDIAPEIVYTVERSIAEYTGGYGNEAGLRHALEALAPTWVDTGIRPYAVTGNARRLTPA